MSDLCARFEDEGLERLERGEPLGKHFTECVDCLEARRVYERLRHEIGQTGGGLRPPVDWQKEVWARIETRSGRTRSGRLRRWGFAGLAAAAVLALVLIRLSSIGPEQASRLTLETHITHQATVVRGVSAQPGDQLTLHAELSGRRYAELRVYREEDELILLCSSEPPCERRGNVLEATVTLPVIGLYQILLLGSDAPLPDSTHGFDEDAGAALRAGAELVTAEEIDVR